MTIVPGGSGETFAATGITIRVHILDLAMNPVYMEAADIVLWNSGLCVCPGGNIADGPTDGQGVATFSGTISGGGFAGELSVYASGILIGTIPVKINSPDAPQASPCAVDASDLASLATARGASVGEPNYSLAMDYNEDGVIDFKDEELMELGKDRCRDIQSKPGGGCLVCDDDGYSPNRLCLE